MEDEGAEWNDVCNLCTGKPFGLRTKTNKMKKISDTLKDSDEEQQGQYLSDIHEIHDDDSIRRILIEEVQQLKTQQVRQHAEIHELKSLQEECSKLHKDEMRALELKIESLVGTWKETALSPPSKRKSGNKNKTTNNDDDYSIDLASPVHDDVPYSRDEYLLNEHPGPEDDSSPPPQSLATGIMKSLQSIFHTNDKSEDSLMTVVEQEDTLLYPNHDQEAQTEQRKDAGLSKSPSRATANSILSLSSSEKKRGTSGNTRELVPSNAAYTRSMQQVTRKHVKGSQIQARTFKKRFIFSLVPTSSSANRKDDDGLVLEEDTFTLMMLNDPYSSYRLPHYVNKIIANCIRAACIITGMICISEFILIIFPHFEKLWLNLFFHSFRSIIIFTPLRMIGMNTDFLLGSEYIIQVIVGFILLFGSRRISLLFTRILRTILALSGPWFLGMVTFAIFQLTLGVSIIVDQWSLCIGNKITDEGCTPFDIPMNVGLGVNVAQCVTVVLVLATQTDILSCIKTVYILRNANHIPWDRVIGKEGNRSWYLWMNRILLPNLLKFIQAVVVLFASFIIIVQSTKTLDLLKDFTALLVVSDADNILFYLTDMGYLGEYLKSKTEEVKAVADRWRANDEEGENTKEQDRTNTDIQGNNETNTVEQGAAAGGNGIVTRSIVIKSRFGDANPNYLVCMFAVLCGTMIGGLSYCMSGQWNGRWISIKYPNCIVRHPRWIGNGRCEHNAPYFSEECGWDGEDCPVGVPERYPNCTVAYPNRIGDGQCDNFLPYNSDVCGYDGGDCIPKAVKGYPNCLIIQEFHHHIGDGECYGYLPYNTPECGYDGGDCDDPLKSVDRYPNCFTLQDDHYMIGDGDCNDSPPYNTLECGYDGGDCTPEPVSGYSNCLVPHPDWIGNGRCYDYPPYNTLECEYDGGDCVPKAVDGYPDCFVPSTQWIGDGECDHEPPYNTPECGYDGGDCRNSPLSP